MMRWLASLVIVLAIGSHAYAQGVLQRAREGTPSAPSPSTPATSSSNSTPPANKSSGSGGDGTDPLDPTGDGSAFLGELFLAGAGACGAVVVGTSPLWLPGFAVGDNYTSGGYFPAYPYASDRPGYQIIDPQWGQPSDKADAQPGDPGFPRNWALRLSAEDGNDFRGLNRTDLRLFVDMKTRLGFMTNWNFLEENLGNGRHDSTTLGDTEVTYRIGQSPELQAFTGLGFRVRTDDVNTRWGFNLFYGGDYYPIKPVVISSSIDIGSIGTQWLFHGRATVGVNYHHFELFGGYDFMRLGGANIQGPLIGLRFWF